MVCVDTCFLVALERREGAALDKMRELANRGEVVYITAVSVAEFYRGAYGSRDRVKSLWDAKGLLALFGVLNLDYESGRLWGELVEALKSGLIGVRDLFVASIALVNRQTIVRRIENTLRGCLGLWLRVGRFGGRTSFLKWFLIASLLSAKDNTCETGVG